MQLNLPTLCLSFLLSCAASASAAVAPRLVPAQDVTVTYSVRPRDHAPLMVQAEIAAGGTRLRITSPDLPTAILVDRPAGRATIMLPMLKLFASVGIGHLDPQRTVLRDARFDRDGQEWVAGLRCTDWTATSSHGRARGCVTDDGVILFGKAADAEGGVATIQATSVRYGPLPPLLFRLPDGYRNAGTLPIDGFGTGQ
jgi:hypothetical protein